jgi:hypothetical protein
VYKDVNQKSAIKSEQLQKHPELIWTLEISYEVVFQKLEQLLLNLDENVYMSEKIKNWRNDILFGSSCTRIWKYLILIVL